MCAHAANVISVVPLAEHVCKSRQPLCSESCSYVLVHGNMPGLDMELLFPASISSL